MNKTKIVATVGPATASKEMLKSLIINGTDVIRINMSHADHSFPRQIVDKVSEINKELNTYTAIMLDIKGPLVRAGKFVNGQAFFKKDDKIRIMTEEVLGDCTKFSTDYPGLINDVDDHTILKVDDGTIEFEVIEKGYDYILCQVIKEGIISNHKSINVINTTLRRPYLSSDDISAIKLAHEMNVDFLALSFVSTYENVLDVNDLLINLGNNHIDLIAKIENASAVNDINNIIKVSDGIMIARGDLGVEVPMEKIPGIQKKIITKCHIAGKVSIVATELMSTMEKNDHPTRAEVSDIANAVLDGTDAVMLCGETTIGKYPIETIKMMEKVLASAEKDIDYLYLMDQASKTESNDTTGVLAYSVAGSAVRLQCKAIFAPTISGSTAKKISRFRPSCPIVAISPNMSTIKSLSLHFGVYPVLIDDLRTLDSIIEKSKKIAIEGLNLQPGDNVIITGGYPFRKVKHTNFMKIEQL